MHGWNFIGNSDGENITYEKGSGTSFSCPVVIGIAALVWSYYPELKASELKNIILRSVVPYKKQTVYCPNIETPEKKKIKFGKLSVTGGIVNAYEAFKLAESKNKADAPIQ